MWRTRAILTQHPMTVIIAIICLLSVFSDDVHSFIDWWSFHAYVLGLFYFFLPPLVEKTIRPSYSNLSRWHVAWILVAALQHFPSSRSTGEVDLLMKIDLFFSFFWSSFLVLTIVHMICLGLWYMGVAPPRARGVLEPRNFRQTCALLSIACCVVYSHCGSRAILKQMLVEGKCYGWFFFWKKAERNRSIPKFLRMNEFKYEICASWFARVGSAYDYPLLWNWMSAAEGAGSSDEVSPLHSFWATFVGLYIANYVVKSLAWWAVNPPSSVEGDEKIKPKILGMFSWYSGSTELFKTGFDLLVSEKLFRSRFDMRMMQAAMNNVDGVEGDLLYDHFREKEDFWFDFMADTGDGSNSSYSIARLLAQPSLNVTFENSNKSLKRGNLLLIGGDLAYPRPSASTYKNKFFHPFKDALQPPTEYKSEQIPTKKPRIPTGFSELKRYDGPQAFIIPGNHDWFDGLHTFMRYICHKSWLGGWFMPQKESYFALQLPKNWWVFGLDLALHHDIDANQFIFFSELVKNKVGDEDSVIILTHEPNWLLDWYENKVSGKKVSLLIRGSLKERCRLRIAGDLHHYMRHSEPSDTPAYVKHLLVNGCGGAFLHPTHVFGNFKEYCGGTYETKASYPSFEKSSRIAWRNIFDFWKKNLRFDFIGGIIYFVLAFSMFPQCELDHILQDDSDSGLSRIFWDAFKYLFVQSYVSLAGALLLLIVSVIVVPSKVSWKKRAMIGGLHAFAHLAAAITIMVWMEVIIEGSIERGLFATSGHPTLYQTVESEYFPDSRGLHVLAFQWASSFCPAWIKYVFMAAFDVQVMVVPRTNICQRGMESLSRGRAASYYAFMFLLLWAVSSPVASMVFGSYLYICVKWLHIHYDEAFSSLRIADHKGFTRFHINSEGDLEVYTLVVDKVPRRWKQDPGWFQEDKEQKQKQKQKRCEEQEQQMYGHHRKFPSKWSSAVPSQDPVETVRIEDYFVIKRTKTTHPVSKPAQPGSEAEQGLRSEKEKEEEARRKKGKQKAIGEEQERSDALPPERETEPIRDSDDERPRGEGKKDYDDERIYAILRHPLAKAQGEPSEKKEAEKGESTNRQDTSAIQQTKSEINEVEEIRSLSCFNLDSYHALGGRSRKRKKAF